MPDSATPATVAAARPRPRWHRSLYWRIAIALTALVALLLAAEGALFLYLQDQTAGAMPGRSPRDMVRLVASDLGNAAEGNPSLDVEKYLRDQYGHYFQTILVAVEGKVVANHDDVEADDLRAAAQLLLFRPGRRGRSGPPGGGPGFDPRGGPPGGRRFGETTPGGGQGFGAPGGTNRGRDNPPGRPPDTAGSGPVLPPGDALGPPPPPPDIGQDGRPPGRRSPPFRGDWTTIFVNGMPRGIAALLDGPPPFSRIVRLVGPTMGLVAGGVLIAGGSLIALLIFGPARKRLLQVQDATERLADGDVLARAPEHGGDEVAALARSFNRMADELTRRTHAVESSDRVRRQLLADVSHELMTPLTAMRGYIETLGMPDLALEQPTRERYMRIVTEETHRIEHIVGDLLDLARLEGGGSTMRRERVPVEMLLERVAERHERELSERHIQMTSTIEPGADEVMGDPDRLEQALQNLAANALRYTPDEGHVSFTASATGSRVLITVRDSGPGIPPDHLPHIFDRFYKVDASRKAAGGSGLGLSIVKAIIERHGGGISARNDQGAVFEIVLPRM
jgi:signal transduction histidine kinase